MKVCYWPIENLPGLTEDEQKKLKGCGIFTTKDLLVKTRTSELKIALAKDLNLHLQHLNKWVILADLARLPSVGYTYCGLLLHSGIASILQLKETYPNRLHREILRLEIANLQRRNLCPSIDVVQSWVKEAKICSTSF